MSYKREYESSRSQGSKRHAKIDMDQLHQDWFPVFQRFNPDQNGEVKRKEMRRLLAVLGEMHRIMPEEAIDDILASADRDANGKISYTEFLDMVIGYNFDQHQRPMIRKALGMAAYAVVPRNERTYVSQYSCRPPPLFMIAISLVEIGVFIYHSILLVNEGKTIGLNGPLLFDSVLIFNPRRRFEAWRFVSYMFVHAGFMHIVFNTLVQLMVGIPLEMVHKWWRVMLVYFSGVILGSLVTSITDPKTFLCGASGGVYALIAAHLASVIMNWSEMEFAWLRLLSLGTFTALDIGTAVYDRYVQQVDTRVSYVAHFAGALAGLLVGINVLRNLKKRTWEKVIWWISLSLFVILIIAAILWNIIDPDNHFSKPDFGTVGTN